MRIASDQRWYFITAFLLAGLLGVVGILVNHTPGESPWLPSCPFHALTGLFCPGCGITRALHALLHGEFVKAFSMNALGIVCLPFMALIWTNKKFRWKWMTHPAAAWILDARIWATLIISYFILRNIPLEPFIRLAPN